VLDQPSRQLTGGTWVAAVIFGLILILNIPLFIRMPLATDVVLYDLQAQMVLNGGTLYKDIFETNLPGIVWLHMLVRSFIGMSSDAIRAVDLLIVSGSVSLLTFMESQKSPFYHGYALACYRLVFILLFPLGVVSLSAGYSHSAPCTGSCLAET